LSAKAANLQFEGEKKDPNQLLNLAIPISTDVAAITAVLSNMALGRMPWTYRIGDTK